MFKISFDNRKIGSAPGQRVFVTLDGTDFPCNEAHPFDQSLFSYKLNAAGIRYDVAINIVTGDIVYWSGGDGAGVYNDLEIARNGVVHLLDSGERILADKGYKDDRYFIYPSDLRGDNCMIKKITGRHENINARLKVWGFLRNRFRHDIPTHNRMFGATIEIEQFKLKNGNRLQNISLDNVHININ